MNLRRLILEFKPDGHEATERNGKRTTRRFLAFTLEDGVNGVNRGEG